MKLSEFRGKAVCLIFWTSTCIPCREIVKYEQSLANSFANKPFVLLGVNLGDDRTPLKKQIKEAGITFRSWWDAGGNLNATGPIARDSISASARQSTSSTPAALSATSSSAP